VRYVYLRVFLSETEQPPLLVASGSIAGRTTRQEYLSQVFGAEFSFTHRGVDMIYVPIKKEAAEDAAFFFGRIGRKVRTAENSGPEEKFEYAEHLSWRASNLILDTSDHNDGQKIAMQERGEVGKPIAILNSMVSYLNQKNTDSGWHLSVNSITERQTFWQAAEIYKGQITKAEFTYITPNVLGIRTELTKRLKEYRALENAQQVTVAISEPRGNLVLDTQEVKDAVDYISEGGGSAKLKVGKETVFDSSDSAKTLEVEVDDALRFNTTEGRKSLIDRVLK
jgi:hypothetical protein